MDRRLNELSQELPSKLSRELRAQETREHQFAKDLNEKIGLFQEQHIRSRDSLRQKQQEMQEVF